MRTRHPSRMAFTLVELLVVLFIIGLLISILLPSLCRSREQGNRVKCASNLRQIGLAIQMYANDNKGNFPRTYFDASDNPVPTAYTGAKAATPFGPGGPASNDVTAGLYLLARTQDLTSEVFVCPSGTEERSAADVRQSSNFALGELSYSYINAYPNKVLREATKRVMRLEVLPADRALAADMNPGGAAVVAVKPASPRLEIRKANSRNHNQDGQNVLYCDGHVEFQTSPFAGETREIAASAHRDNVYVSGGPGTDSPPAVYASPVDALDTVLLPAADPATGPSPLTVSMNTREFGARRIVWLSSAVVLLGACGAGGAALRVAKKRRRVLLTAPDQTQRSRSR